MRANDEAGAVSGKGGGEREEAPRVHRGPGDLEGSSGPGPGRRPAPGQQPDSARCRSGPASVLGAA